MRDPEATPLTPTLRSYLGAAALVAELVPVVDLADETTRFLEVVVRGERNGPFADPRALWSSLAAFGATVAIDEWRWQEALRLVAKDPDNPLPVIVPLHPDSMAELGESLHIEPTGRLRPVLDIPCHEAVFRAPDMARAVDQAREERMPVFVSEIVDEHSLTLVGVLGADALRLAPEMMRGTDIETSSRRAAAVSSMVVRPGPLLFASGVDDEADRRHAVAFGVDGASGRALRAGGSTAAGSHRLWRKPGEYTERGTAKGSLFELVARGMAPRRVSRRELDELSRETERVILADARDGVLVGALQTAAHFTDHTAERWSRFAGGCSVIVAAGRDMPPEPAPGVEGLALAAEDPLVGEWHVAVLSPTRAAVVSARETGASGDRRFELVYSYDGSVVASVCRGILGRIPGRNGW